MVTEARDWWRRFLDPVSDSGDPEIRVPRSGSCEFWVTASRISSQMGLDSISWFSKAGPLRSPVPSPGPVSHTHTPIEGGCCWWRRWQWLQLLWECVCLRTRGWGRGVFSSLLRMNMVVGLATRHSLNGAHFKNLIILCNTFSPRSKQFSYWSLLFFARLKSFLK